MKTIGKSACYALSVATLCVAGCAGSQAPSLIPQMNSHNAPPAVSRAYHGSWMSPQAKNDDLVYVSNAANDTVTAYGLTTHKLEGVLTDIYQPFGACSDTQGNVWIVAWGNNRIIKYPHGGTQPLETLTVQDQTADLRDCSVDPTTGNLAVTNWGYHWYQGNVLIFAQGRGKPTKYTGPGLWYPVGCDYDDKGNLWADGWDAYLNGYVALGELHKGGKGIANISLIPSMQPPILGTVRWDGRYVAIGSWETIQEYAVKGSFAYLRGSTALTYHWPVGMFSITTYRGRQIVIAPDTAYSPNAVQYWKYPIGGAPTATITGSLNGSYGAVVSLAAK
jgi:hypothetical protein